uniref:ubiquitinyl hydrolase 1 n=1 Tax=Brassica campestris TaxID=3711 RepID=M4EJ73_BRACM
MVSHEENVSIVEWFLGPPSYTYPPYGVELIHEEDQSLHHHHQSGEYYREYEDHHSSSDVDNDEIIARTLQDDFLQLQIAENNGNYSNHHQHQQEEDYTHNYSSNNNEYGWNDQPTTRDYSSEWLGNDNDQDGSPNIYSCSSPSDTEEYVYSWESDQCDTDGEFGRRLNQMVPIPYVPKTNGEIPPEEEAVSDHDRLRNRLEMFDFAEVRVPGDGNCQFRALADQLYKTADRHKHVRKQIVKQLKASPDSYEGYVPMEFSDYLKKMSRSGEWGDHVTLQAAADAYRVKIVVLTSFKNTCYIEIIPTSQESKGVIFLSFWAEVHYNSIYLNKDPSPAIYIATTQNEPFNIPFLVNEVPWLTWDRLLFHRRDKTRSGFSLLYPTQDMNLGFVIGVIGVLILSHAAYSTIQYRGLLKITEEEFTGPPLNVVLELIVGLALCMWAALTFPGKFLSIHPDSDENRAVSLPDNSDFMIFNHRGRLFPPEITMKF